MNYFYKHHKSIALIGFGILQIMLSLTLTILALTVITTTGDVPAFAFTAFSCGLVFLIMGTFSTYAGFNVWERNGMIVISFAMGVLGSILATANIIINIENLNWHTSDDNCLPDCLQVRDDFKETLFCYRVCSFMLFKWVFIVLSALNIFLSIVLCSLYFYKSKHKYQYFQNEIITRSTYDEANYTRSSPVTLF